MSTNDIRFRAIRCGASHSHRIFEDSRAIQQAVFIDEQGVRAEKVFDHQHDATHYVCYIRTDDAWLPVACARVRRTDSSLAIKIERVATLKEHRGNKYAYRLLEHIIEEQGERYGPPFFYLNSQLDAQGLYEALNFEPQGDVFSEEDIRHVRMELRWPLATAA
jgi:predicted GNAT family N-acyltransferase